MRRLLPAALNKPSGLGSFDRMFSSSFYLLINSRFIGIFEKLALTCDSSLVNNADGICVHTVMQIE